MDDIKIDELIRARRKSIGLIITNDARLIVRAPYSAPLNYIQQLVNQKRSWITKKRRFFFDKKTTTFSKTFCDGEQFLFLGQRYPLTIDDNLAKSVIFDGTLRIARVSLANAKDHLGYWYKAQANDFIHQRVEHYANLCGLTYQSIKLNEAKTRWGSCGYKNTLNFTWRLIMAPPKVVDYVVVHELMHLKQRNHSRKFWAEVAKIIPDYKLDERWLKENGHLMRWES